jgi:UDP-hydrolysing UDP-N-acetyl-D-glucosamine 2-epimerase
MRSEPLRIMAVTGSRADWGYLSVPLSLMRNDPAFRLSLVVTGQHLDTRSGNTIDAIRAEGFDITACVDMMLEDDTPRAVTKSLGLGVEQFAAVVDDHKPELMILLGDRYEILGAAMAALLHRIPIAHLAGGDISEGAIDDAIRHAITKLSHLHFPTNADAAARIAQMGEDPSRIHAVGSTGLDRLLQVPIMGREEFFRTIAFVPQEKNLLVTMHPVTLAANPLADADAMLAAVESYPDTGLIFTGSNADSNGRELTAKIIGFVERRNNVVFCPSLGTTLYVNALAHCNAVVGNSSSGLYEAPSMRVPTVNIGSRQDGRLRARSVIDTVAEPDAIRTAISAALALDCSDTVNPFGDGRASHRILAVLREIEDPFQLLKKRFYREMHQ